VDPTGPAVAAAVPAGVEVCREGDFPWCNHTDEQYCYHVNIK
jgi:hypothetical protein